MSTDLGQVNYTYNVSDGMAPNPLQLLPSPGYTTYASWEFDAGTATPNVDYTFANQATEVLLPASGLYPQFSLITHLHAQDEFFLTVHYLIIDPTSGQQYTQTAVFDIINAADDIGVPAVSDFAYNMPTALNLIPAPSEPGESVSGYNRVNSDGSWSNPNTTVPSTYASGTSTQSLADEWGVGTYRAFRTFVDPWVAPYGAQDVSDVGQITSKFISNELGDIQQAILSFNSGSPDQLLDNMEKHASEFLDETGKYLVGKAVSAGLTVADGLFNVVDKIAIGIHEVENVFNFSFFDASSSTATSTTPAAVGSVVRGEVAQAFQPGATIIVNDNNDVGGGGAAKDWIYLGDANSLVQFQGHHNIAEIIGTGHYTVQFQGSSSQYGIINYPGNSGAIEVTDQTLGRDGTNILLGVNYLQFTDRTIVVASPIFGTAGDDTLIGTANNDLLNGFGGNDVLIGGGDVITPALGSLPTQSGQMGTEWHVVSEGDFGGDGKGDIMWVRNTTGDAALWTMNNGALSSFSFTQGHMGSEWTAFGSGDFNHDGNSDLLWARKGTGDVAIWEMNGPNLSSAAVVSGHMGAEWHVVGIGDFNGDGNSDILWFSNTGSVVDWSMNGTTLGGLGNSNGHIGTEWHVGGTGDFNGDGRDDVLWVRNTGDVQTWTMNGSNVTGVQNTGHMGPEWHVGATGDFNMDGKTDVVWVDTSNNVQIWEMNGGQISQIVTPAGHLGTEWQLKGAGDFTGDGRPDLLWVNTNGQTSVWNMAGNGDIMTGGAGQDTFQFNDLSQLGKIITDFQPGSGGDILDLHNLDAAAGYGGHNALTDGALRLIQNGADTEVQVDTHYGEHHWADVVTLQNVNASSLVHGNFIL